MTTMELDTGLLLYKVWYILRTNSVWTQQLLLWRTSWILL